MKNYLDFLKLKRQVPLEGLKDLSRFAATEGIVLLKNEDALPLSNKINVFGRIQLDYYKSGTGSGGLVNVSCVTSIIEALKESPYVTINETLLSVYQDWQKDHPFNAGLGRWATEPWSQTEMALSEEVLLQAQAFSNQAVIIIGRTAGEDKDNTLDQGSYYLSEFEEQMLEKVSNAFAKTTVVLNVGNPIDMSFLDKYQISACLYVWHGGEEGGRAVSDVLTGVYTPSGKLPMTIAKKIEDHYAHKNFGNAKENYYEEDIYVGYRYFETFNQKAVRFPFGSGLSYSRFEYEVKKADVDNFSFEVDVKNLGPFKAKEIVFIFIEAPNGLLGKPTLTLVGFQKTPLLDVNQTERLYFEFNKYDFASYDELGLTGFPSSYVLEKGIYHIHISKNIRDVIKTYSFNSIENECIFKAKEALRPVKSYNRLKAVFENGIRVPKLEKTPVRTIDLDKRILEQLGVTHENTCIQKRTLFDVYQKRVTLEAFISQLSDEELAQLTRGEGMSGPKVTPGTASAFGGVSEGLKHYGFPIACCADGPSGIRMDSGFLATSLPNGTLLAASFNETLVEALYYALGLELRNYNIDVLLGPGINIQRHPLCGRNFEYFSEDPFVTGHIAKSVIRGLKKAGVSGTLKHLAANNQESFRTKVDSVVSERALREIYLRGFEIAIKEGKAQSIMTAYNPVNGIWSASNYDLNTTIIRDEFGFKGIIMTDWWASMNDENETESMSNTKAMIRAQNDLYMVTTDATLNSNNDNTLESLKNQTLMRAQLQKVGKNIAQFLTETDAFRRLYGLEFTPLKTHFYLPYLDSVKINGKHLDTFDPKIGHYVLDVKNHFTVDFKASKGDLVTLKKSANSVLLTVFNHREQNTYLFTNIKREIAIDNQDYGILDNDKLIFISDDPKDHAKLQFDKLLYLNDQISINDTQIKLDKDGIVSFGLEVKSYGKYIFEFEISSPDDRLAQIPFSVLVDKMYKSTITTHGTLGNKQTVNPFILLEEGKHLCSFKAHKSGLMIHSILVSKHP
ncbi:MAG: glycoside hydrolase family 3 C-terminal domain-containing protein [Acholeplasma sp.]|nr:glycoside hydrolase family 3 C-terminal domain-containing protein [Acholeplasma sp.]